jgi:serine/threonine protein phosphatase 1
MSINVVADIAGRFDELLLLLKKMPEADLTVCLGDLPDRGSQSKQVIEYLMTAPKTLVIKGNHDQLMVDACRNRETDGVWTWNGGDKTIECYGGIDFIPEEHIKWLDSRPIYMEFPDLILSHAPIYHMDKDYFPKSAYSRDFKDIGCHDHAFIWNRFPPPQSLGKFHIHGHNSTYKEYSSNGQIFAICLDNSARSELRGIHWNNKLDYQLYCQEYVNGKHSW